MKDILIMHFIAEPHTNSRCRLTGVVAAARSRAELHDTVNDLMCPNTMNAIDLQGNKLSSVARYAAYNFIELFASSRQVGPGA